MAAKSRKPTTKPDVEFLNNGSIMLVVPLTPAAKEWVADNLALEGWQWMGNAFACEPRYAGDLAQGMADAGLVVS